MHKEEVDQIRGRTRTLGIVIGLIIVVVIAALSWLLQATLFGVDSTSKSNNTLVTFTDLPANYCPKTVNVKVTDQFNEDMTVINCRQVDLSNLATYFSGTTKIIITLPFALPLSLVAGDLQSSNKVTLTPQLGDIDGNGIIDEKDEKLVVDNLFTKNPVADIDGDGTVTSADLALVRIHQGTATTGLASGSAI